MLREVRCNKHGSNYGPKILTEFLTPWSGPASLMGLPMGIPQFRIQRKRVFGSSLQHNLQFFAHKPLQLSGHKRRLKSPIYKILPPPSILPYDFLNSAFLQQTLTLRRNNLSAHNPATTPSKRLVA